MSKFARTLESWKGCDPKAMVSMSSAAIHYALSDAKHDIVKLHADFDRVTAERDAAMEDLSSANSDKDAYAQNAIDLRKRVDVLQHRLASADERADLLEGMLKSGSSPTYAHYAAVMEALKPAEGGGDEA